MGDKVQVIFVDNGELCDLTIRANRSDGAVTQTAWLGKPKSDILRAAHSHLNDFKNARDKQKETVEDLNVRIPKLEEHKQELIDTAIPNLEDAIKKLEEIVPEGYDPTEV